MGNFRKSAGSECVRLEIQLTLGPLAFDSCDRASADVIDVSAHQPEMVSTIEAALAKRTSS
jgi:hypothetical protein